ncbi:YcgN family cysteine cluster protein [Ferrimonas sp. SCSIO 43195]|uniref:YcgN family cysteine cluster protein n=2 Tax=Ferrimonas TaxID=44011 RepID=UPI0003FA3EA1|nr:YcgN family cysteine cluster protein [Ferrimonas kyonanensis]USD39312.1 YcgN family cysteine cluster protein [Ferrimonas sp. SCSIO 43195]
MSEQQPFWHKPLQDMTEKEWESLCDGCGKCCLNKLIDDDTEEVYFTNVACKLLNDKTCDCQKYERRFEWVPDCYKVTPENVATIEWLPPSCSYRRLQEGRGLPSWHPLLTGSKSEMHKQGMSVRRKVLSELHVGPDPDLIGYIVVWPLDEID